MNRPHPLDSPDFGKTSSQKIWYLAHPLATDEHYTFQQNMDHVVHMMRLLFDCGIRTIAPYHTMCLALDDDNLEHRRIGLEVDCEIVKRLGGRVILTGHKLSRGMNVEVLTAKTSLAVSEGEILNFIAWKDEVIEYYFQNIDRVMGNAK